MRPASAVAEAGIEALWERALLLALVKARDNGKSGKGVLAAVEP
jgi:hypothetical protein